jgi:transposase
VVRKRAGCAAIDVELKKREADVSRRSKTPLSAQELAVRFGRITQRSNVAKHFEVTIEEGRFLWTRTQQTIEREASLDGIYVIRTSEGADALPTVDVVRTVKVLAQFERVFRSLKSVDLLSRPIHHWGENHVRAQIFVCLLSYYVQWEVKRALAPLLYSGTRS